MARKKRGTFIWIFLFLLLTATLGLFLALQKAPAKIKSLIEVEGSKALNGIVRVENVALSFSPLGVKVSGISARLFEEGIEAAVPVALTSAKILKVNPPSFLIHLELQRPEVSVKLPLRESSTSGSGASTGSQATPPNLPLAFQLHLKSGKVEMTQAAQTAEELPVKLALTNLNIDLGAPGLQEDLSLQVQSNLLMERGSLSLNLPLSANATINLNLPSSTIKAQKARLELGGISFHTTGWMQWSTQKHAWRLITNIPELKNLKAAPTLLPKGKWSGAIISAIDLSKEANWRVDGNVQLRNLVGDIDVATNNIAAKGGLSLQATSDFSWNESLKIKSLKSDVQLKSLDLAYENLFKKPAGVPLAFKLDASSQDNNLHLKSLEFTLAQLHGRAFGTISSAAHQPSQLSIKVPKTQLIGFEKLIPPLSENPVQGQVQADVEIKGPLQNPDGLSVRIAPLLIEGLRAKVNYKKDDLQVSGPVSLDLRATMFTEGQNLRASNISALADLSAMQIQIPGTFIKSPGLPLKMELSARQKAQKISVEKGLVRSSVGELIVKGDFQNPQRPQLNLSGTMSKINLKNLSDMTPLLKPMGLSGSASGKLQVQGVYDFKKGIEQSPLKISGEIQAHIPRLTYKPKKSPTTDTESAVPPPPPEPLLPPWPVARQLDLRSNIKIDSLTYDTIPIEKLHWTGQLRNGKLTGKTSIAKIFGGSVDIVEIGMDLSQPAPTTKASFFVTNLNLGPAFNWIFPTWKGLLDGAATGRMSVSAAHPSRKDFIEATLAKGEIAIKNGFVSTLKFDNWANSIFKKIPGLSNQKLQSGGAKGDLKSQFIVAKGTVKFDTFSLKTPEQNQLESNGYMKLDKTLDMKGVVYLANARGSGEAGEIIAANSDRQGRFEVPIRISGSAFDPELNITEETVKKILEKTANYKISRAKRELKAQGEATLKKELEKGKSKVQEELKKGLQNIFNK